MTGPLDGVRVLDLSRVIAGPHAGRILADLGADVIKLEPPEADITRRARPRRADVSVYFTHQNAGKRCVSIDLGRPEGLSAAKRIAVASDVVLDNFRPGVMERLGLDHDTLSANNPRVISCSVTGYGRDGPVAGRRAYAPVIHAEAGLVDFIARKRGTDPSATVLSYADIYAGLHAVIGILSALHDRAASGRGRRVTISMAEALLLSHEWTAVELAGGPGDKPHVFGAWASPVAQLGDGTWISSSGDAVSTFPQWAAACGHPEALDDSRFATKEARQANRDDMDKTIASWVSEFDSVEALEAACEPHQIAIGVVRTLDEAATSDWAKAAGSIAWLDDRGGDTVGVPRTPYRIDGLQTGPSAVGAWQGEHNREILREVGLSDAEINELEASSVLVSRPPR